MRRQEILARAWAARKRKEEFINSLSPEEAYANKSQATRWKVATEEELANGAEPIVAEEGKYYSYDCGNLYICKQTHETSWNIIPSTSPEYFEKINVESEEYVAEKVYPKNAIVLDQGRFFKSMITRNDKDPEEPEAWKKLTIG